MFDFNTLPELFKHIQENIKEPYYLNYRNNEVGEGISNETFMQTPQGLSGIYSRVEIKKSYVIASTDNRFRKEYDCNEVENHLGGV